MKAPLHWTLWTFAFLFSLQTTAFAESGEAAGALSYTIREGDSCASIAQQLYGNARFYFVIHDYNPHAGRDRASCDESLRPGTTLRLPRQAPEEGARRGKSPDAEVTAVQRVVKSRPPERTSWSKAHPGQDLYRGWRVNTLEESAADVTFQDESLLRLRENTLVIIFGPMARKARRVSSRAVLESGSLRTRLGELSGQLRVETPSARAQLGEGEVLVTVDEELTSRVANHLGADARVASKRGRGAVAVRAGMGTKVQRGRRPTPPRPLPPTPTWRDGSPSLFVGIKGRQSLISGAWNPVAEAEHYRVEIATKADGRGPVGAVGVPAKIERFELRGLRPGRYYVAVSAIDDDRFESRPSAWQEVELVELELITPQGELAEQSGDSSAEPLRLLAGSVINIPEGMSCRHAGGQASTEPAARELILDEPGRQEIVCQSGEREAEIIEVEIVSLAITPHGAEAATEMIELVRGEATTVILELESELGVPTALSATASDGVVVESSRVVDGGRLELSLRVADDAPEQVDIAVVSSVGERSLRLASVRARTMEEVAQADEPPAPTCEEATPPAVTERPMAATEVASLLVGPAFFGLRDEQRRASNVWAAFGYLGALGGNDGDRYAVALGGQARFFDGRLHMGLGTLVNFTDEPVGVKPSVGYRFMSGRFGIGARLGAWIPFEAPREGDYRATLMPSVDLSLRLADRWILRSSQGLQLDTARDGGFYWASAYGVDVRVAGPFIMGIEGALLLGNLEWDTVVAPTLGLNLGLELGPFEIAAMVRYGFTDQAVHRFGRLSGLIALRFSP